MGIPIDDDKKSVKVFTCAGKAVSYLDGIQISWGDTPLGNGPTGRAIRSAQVQFNNNMYASPQFQPWLDRAKKSNLQSSFALPVKLLNGQVVAAFTVYSERLNAFGDEELMLIGQLAADMGYGVQAIRTRSSYENSIAELNRLNQLLLQSEERLRLAFLATPGGVWDWNIVTGDFIVGAEWLSSLGYSLSDFEPTIRFWEKLLHPDDVVNVFDTLQAHFEGKSAFYECEYRMRTKAGDWRWRDSRGKVVEWDDNGKPARVVGINVDITERKKTEDELRSHRANLEQLVEERTTKLKEVNKQLIHAEKLSALGKYTGAIAHEFNNPLLGLRMLLEQLQDEATLSETDQKNLGLAISECNRMAKLIEQLQSFYKPSPQLKVETCINQIIKDVITLLGKRLATRQIKLETNFDPNLPKARVVPDQIKQVTLNMIQNAEESISADRTDGEIIISTQNKEGEILIRFKDNGSGIPEGIHEKVFEPFFTTKSTVKGTGLGLSVSHGIIESHGGRIQIDSQPGKGTAVMITLPSTHNHFICRPECRGRPCACPEKGEQGFPYLICRIPFC